MVEYFASYREARGPLESVDPEKGEIVFKGLDLYTYPKLVLNSNLNEFIGKRIGIIRLPVDSTNDRIYIRLLEES
jgi:hypothetical protein